MSIESTIIEAPQQASALPELVLINLRMGHHAGHSGYDRLTDFLNPQAVIGTGQMTLLERCVARLLRPLVTRSGIQWYHRENLITELRVALDWLKRAGCVFHFLYGENSYRYLGVIESLSSRNSIVCTYHMPRDRLLTGVTDLAYMRRMDAAVAVSSSQLEWLGESVGQDRVFFVPHGVDVDYYRPGESEEREAAEHLRCVFAGRHMRDFETLRSAAAILSERQSRVKIEIVTDRQRHGLFDGMENVFCHADISDEALLGLYQQSDLLLMPLTDCTANNTLLEGMACGLPVVSTDLAGVRDYADAACSELVPLGDSGALADVIEQLAGDRQKRRAMARASRARAEAFSWERVSRQMQRVYEQALSS